MRILFKTKRDCRKKPVRHAFPWTSLQKDLLDVQLSTRRSQSCSRSSSPLPGLAEGTSQQCCCWGVCCLRLVQALFLMLVGYALYTLAAAAVSTSTAPTPPPSPQSPSPQRPVRHYARNLLSDPPRTQLLDLDDFEYIHEAEGTCAPGNLYFVFLVHSKPDHFRQRQVVRATWGSTGRFGDWTVRVVFLLGKTTKDPEVGELKEAMEMEEGGGGGGGLPVGTLVDQEARRHGDIVLGSFVDDYHNLTYKHVMGLKWAQERCPHAVFLVKADDDAFIDVPGLQAFMARTYGAPPPSPRNTLVCNVLPEGTPPLREGKWAVSTSEYPWSEYPAYCGGLAYLVTPDVARDLYRVAHAPRLRRLWVDDVWITGVLAEAIGVTPYYLNLRYTYDPDELTEWLERARADAPPPYMVAHLDPSRPDWRRTVERLWSHAQEAHKAKTATTTTTTTKTTFSSPDDELGPGNSGRRRRKSNSVVGGVRDTSLHHR
ncbi:uncharacterized protein LOC143034153 [Oratosquilla oratoria]|uniref:uncharacterized protein LOC143034153 n=1 Tax=Oratosquilla oratoria TaxID=337810 RepID=UPI003F760FE3